MEVALKREKSTNFGLNHKKSEKTLCPILTAAEGQVLGVGVKMFTIAGPVLVFGMAASAVYGVIYYIAGLI